MRLLRISLAAAAAAVVLVVILSASSSSPTTQSLRPAPAASHDSSHQRPTAVRSLAVTTGAEPDPSARADRMRAQLLEGRLPAGAVTATVLTDEDCAADADGVSHCRNKLRLSGGKTIEVRHPHRMHQVPCMTPGEVVRVGRAGNA
jgi:hypothetical protein